jgi:quinol monooxygenase YgiN
MPVYEIAQFDVRPEARVRAERAMHEFANYVRAELPDSSWTTYRDPGKPHAYMAITVAASPAARARHRSAPGTQAFLSAIEPLLDGAINITDCDLVTSSDLGKRPPPRGR